MVFATDEGADAGGFGISLTTDFGMLALDSKGGSAGLFLGGTLNP